MDATLAIIGTTWPILGGLAAVVYALIKLHVDMENIKEKIKVLFQLHNERTK